MLSLPFYKLSPGGNPTLLIPEAALPPDAARPDIARALMDADHLGAEQVGFIDAGTKPPRLSMMGGEFCVNACRAAALVFARLGGLPVVGGQSWAGDIAASGLAEPVRAQVRALPDGGCSAAVAVPLPQASPEDLAPGITLVRLPGIAHLLLDTRLHARPIDWQGAARELRRRFTLEDQEAVGVIWHEATDPAGPADSTARRIHPAVWVRDTGSLVMETACGSGSLALALWCKKKSSADSFPVRQASGLDLCVRFENPAAPLAWIDGPVRLVAEGTAYL